MLKSKISGKEFRISKVFQGLLVLQCFLSFNTVDWLFWLPKFSVMQSQTHRPWVGMKKCVLTMSTHDDSTDFDLRTEISFLWQFHFSDPALPAYCLFSQIGFTANVRMDHFTSFYYRNFRSIFVTLNVYDTLYCIQTIIWDILNGRNSEID